MPSHTAQMRSPCVQNAHAGILLHPPSSCDRARLHNQKAAPVAQPNIAPATNIKMIRGALKLRWATTTNHAAAMIIAIPRSDAPSTCTYFLADIGGSLSTAGSAIGAPWRFTGAPSLIDGGR